jgi:hypothetical protein
MQFQAQGSGVSFDASCAVSDAVVAGARRLGSSSPRLP